MSPQVRFHPFYDHRHPTTSDYAEDLERVYQSLSKMPVITESFCQAPGNRQRIGPGDSALNILKERMSQSDRSLNIRNRQMFNTPAGCAGG